MKLIQLLDGIKKREFCCSDVAIALASRPDITTLLTDDVLTELIDYSKHEHREIRFIVRFLILEILAAKNPEQLAPYFDVLKTIDIPRALTLRLKIMQSWPINQLAAKFDHILDLLSSQRSNMLPEDNLLGKQLALTIPPTLLQPHFSMLLRSVDSGLQYLDGGFNILRRRLILKILETLPTQELKEYLPLLNRWRQNAYDQNVLTQSCLLFLKIRPLEAPCKKILNLF